MTKLGFYTQALPPKKENVTCKNEKVRPKAISAETWCALWKKHKATEPIDALYSKCALQWLDKTSRTPAADTFANIFAAAGVVAKSALTRSAGIGVLVVTEVRRGTDRRRYLNYCLRDSLTPKAAPGGSPG